MTMRPISEDDLQAFVDNALDEERRRDVLAYLRDNAAAATRVSAYQRQAAALRSAMDPVASEPIPSRLNLKTIATSRTTTHAPRYAQMAAAAIVLLAIGGMGGWMTKDYMGPPTEGVAALAQEASATYNAFASDRIRPVELKADDPQALQQFAGETLGRTTTVPDLTKAGYRLMGARVIPTVHGAGVMLMYDNDKGSRLVMLTRHMIADQNKPMVPTNQGDIGGWSWAKNGMGYSLIGSLPLQDLHPIADEARSQI
ncbi:anti-sigma factor family protein [Oryzifoliimicrobium ureilyticus]|uniref:anti-sigma factor family protein n=1 Tax=Oryzifoliimicrobium ureilyticus TaxID=3113724 RepID=UPI00307673DD